jgi:hypothetical protein
MRRDFTGAPTTPYVPDPTEGPVTVKFARALAKEMADRWSPLLQCKLEPEPDGTYDLLCRSLPHVEHILQVVAEMPMVPEGPCDDLFCPFSCGAEGEEADAVHAADCPIMLAAAALPFLAR